MMNSRTAQHSKNRSLPWMTTREAAAAWRIGWVAELRLLSSRTCLRLVHPMLAQLEAAGWEGEVAEQPAQVDVLR